MKLGEISFAKFCSEILGVPCWPAWEVFFAAVEGRPLSLEGAQLFEACCGRAYKPGEPVRDASAVVGRRAGKTWHSIAYLLYRGLVRPPKRRSNDPLWITATFQDQRAAKDVAIGYVRQMVEGSPFLRDEVEDILTTEVRFRSGLRFVTRPCTLEAPRSLSIFAALLDECGFYSQEGSSQPDTEIERAVSFGMLTFPDRLLLRISSPRLRSGILWREFGKRSQPGVICWQAASQKMNPELNAADLETMRRDDPEGFEREVLGEFVDNVSGFFTHEAITDAMQRGYEKLPPVSGVTYTIGLDAAFSRDDFGLSICHRESDGSVMVDLVRHWTTPTPVETTLGEVAALCREYRATSPWADQFSFSVLQALAGRYGLSLKQEPMTQQSKAEMFGTMRALLNSGRLFLPKNEKLRREMAMLEARALPGGGARIAAAPGAKDDLIHAVALAAWKAQVGADDKCFCGLATGGQFNFGGYGYDRAWEKPPEAPRCSQCGEPFDPGLPSRRPADAADLCPRCAVARRLEADRQRIAEREAVEKKP